MRNGSAARWAKSSARSGSRGARRLVGRAVAFAAGGCVIAACAYGLMRAAADPRFALTGVAVRGSTHTANLAIVLAAALPTGQNIWLLNTRAAERRVEALPWVRSARVARAWPNSLTIQIAERIPAARVAQRAGTPPAQFALIDADMHVIGSVQGAPEFGGLPLLRIQSRMRPLSPGDVAQGSQVEQAYDALVQLRALGVRVSEVDLADATGIAAVTEDGLRVIFGDDRDLAAKVNLYKAIVPKLSAPRMVAYVDLRSVRAPTVLYR